MLRGLVEVGGSHCDSAAGLKVASLAMAIPNATPQRVVGGVLQTFHSYKGPGPPQSDPSTRT